MGLRLAAHLVTEICSSKASMHISLHYLITHAALSLRQFATTDREDGRPAPAMTLRERRCFFNVQDETRRKFRTYEAAAVWRKLWLRGMSTKGLDISHNQIRSRESGPLRPDQDPQREPERAHRCACMSRSAYYFRLIKGQLQVR